MKLKSSYYQNNTAFTRPLEVFKQILNVTQATKN